MAKFGSTDRSLNAELTERLHTGLDGLPWNEAHMAFVRRAEAAGKIPGVLEFRVCHDNSDGAGRQTAAYMQGFAEACGRLGKPAVTCTAIVPDSAFSKRPERAYFVVERKAVGAFSRRLRELSITSEVMES